MIIRVPLKLCDCPDCMALYDSLMTGEPIEEEEPESDEERAEAWN